MKRDNINYFYVGSFVLLMLSLLLATVLRLTGQNKDTVNYTTVYGSITGIKYGTSISFGGYNIGYVSAVTLSIMDDWPIPSDSIVSIIQPGLLSENQIEITEGNSDSLLKPGDTLASRDAINISAIFGDLSSDIKPLLKNMTLKFPEITQNLNSLLVKLNKSAEQLILIADSADKNKIVSIIDNTEKFSQNFLQASAQLSNTSNELSILITNSNQLMSANKDHINASVDALHKSLSSLSENIDAIVYNLDTASRNMNEFTRQLRDNPAVLLSGKPPIDKAEANQ